MSDTITVTDTDVARVAATIEAGGPLGADDMHVMSAIFFLAGYGATELEPDVEGFMPAYMKLGDIKGESSSAAPPVNMHLNFKVNNLGGLANSFNLGAVGDGSVIPAPGQ